MAGAFRAFSRGTPKRERCPLFFLFATTPERSLCCLWLRRKNRQRRPVESLFDFENCSSSPIFRCFSAASLRFFVPVHETHTSKRKASKANEKPASFSFYYEFVL